MKLIRKIKNKLMKNPKKTFIICNIILASLFYVTFDFLLDFKIWIIFIVIFYRILLIFITIFNCYYIYKHPKDELIILTFLATILSIPLFLICTGAYLLMVLTYIILFIIINKPENVKRSTLKNIIFIIFNISLILLYYITNGKDLIIEIYPIIFMVIIILITIFNCYYIYKNPKNNLVGAIAITSIVFSFPLSDVFPILYLLIILSYLLFFIINKKIVLIFIGIVVFILTLTFSIESYNYNHNSEDSTKAVDIGFSPTKKYYGYCESYKLANNKKENKFYWGKKKLPIDIFNTVDPLEQDINISTCKKGKIKWITDDEIEVNGKKISIKNKWEERFES